MNEQLRDQISAFLDDELPPSESELLVRRLGRDEAIHATATRYLLIGQTLRGEMLGHDPLGLVRALHRRIELDGGEALPGNASAEDVVPATSVTARWWRPASGAAAAAAVALIALVSLQNLGREDAQPVLMATDATQSVPPAPTVTPRQFGVPAVARDNLPGQPVSQPAIRLTNYLMSHGEVAGGLGRKTIHSGIVGTSAAQIMGGYVETPPVTPEPVERGGN